MCSERYAVISKVLILFLVSFIPFISFSQIAVDPTEKSLNRTFYLTLGMDIGLKQLSGNFYDHYEGEFLEFDSTNNSSEIIWTEKTTESNTLAKDYKLRSYQLTTMLQFSKHWSVGLNYHLFLLLDRSSDATLGESKNYFGIAVAGDYEHHFKKIQGLSWNHTPSIGWYQGGALNEGPGIELYGEWKESITYRIKNSVGIKFYIADDYFLYRERTLNERFNMTESVDVKLNDLQFGFGISWRFAIVPD